MYDSFLLYFKGVWFLCKYVLGRFIKKKEDFDSENIICPIKDYDRDKYLNRRIIIRILFVILYGYELGYMLAIKF